MHYLDKRKPNEAQSFTLPETIFDPEAIANIQQLQMPNGPDILEQFMQLFLKAAKELIQDFKAGIENNDLKKVSFALHTLKSSTASLGANTFTKLCAHIETAALAGDADIVFSQADSLMAKYEEIETILEQYIAEKKILISGLPNE